MATVSAYHLADPKLVWHGIFGEKTWLCIPCDLVIMVTFASHDVKKCNTEDDKQREDSFAIFRKRLTCSDVE